MKTRVILAGATGWAGSALARAILQSDDLQLVGGVSAKHAGARLGDVLDLPGTDVLLSASAEEALDAPCDVFVEYTNHLVAKRNVMAAITCGTHVVIGTSGISDEEFLDVHNAAQKNHVGVLAVGNFSIPACVLFKCAELAAKQLKSWEVIDYASENKPDAPSGTVRELANRLSKIRKPNIEIPVHKTDGIKETRGGTLNGMQVHSIRLPGFMISAEVIFGEFDQRLSIRYDAGTSPEAYVPGALLAIRNVHCFEGLKRGLDSVLEL